jgi:hypothetical protein
MVSVDCVICISFKKCLHLKLLELVPFCKRHVACSCKEDAMKWINKTLAAGTLGTAAVACAGCCIGLPLLGPLLAWSGLSAAGALATGWYAGMVSVFAVGVTGLIAWRRRRAAMRARQACGCSTVCRVDASPPQRLQEINPAQSIEESKHCV